MGKVKAVLFGMTGFGNNALSVLSKHPAIELSGVFTPPCPGGAFPYYRCKMLQDAVRAKGIPLYEGLSLKDMSTVVLIGALAPKVIIVSSFNQIVPKSIVKVPDLGVLNVHPSLLPKYRGATPTVWALLNDEKETGVTVHFIEDEKVDHGEIVAQAALKIRQTDDDGALRRRLALLSESVLSDALDRILSNGKKVFLPQNEAEATYYPKRSLKDAEIDINKPFQEIVNKLRAMSPYPGAYLVHEGLKYSVKAVFLSQGEVSGTHTSGEKFIVVHTPEGMIKFQVEKEN